MEAAITKEVTTPAAVAADTATVAVMEAAVAAMEVQRSHICRLNFTRYFCVGGRDRGDFDKRGSLDRRDSYG